MGFFSDLKEDLSQAVNELLPMDEQSVKDNTDQQDVSEEVIKAQIPETEEPAGLLGDVSLEEMLKNIDDIEIPQDEAEEPSLEEMLASAIADIPESGDEETVTEPETIPETVPETMPEETYVREQEPAGEEEIKGAEREMDGYVSGQAVEETAVVTGGMEICGDVISEGSLDVNGVVNGNIDVQGRLNITGYINGNSSAAEIYAEGAKINGEMVSAGAVKIGKDSVIIGNITATSAVIAGAVKGDIDVHGPVVLDSTAIVKGNIKSKSVQINNDAAIEGMCSQCYADVSPTSFFDDYEPETKGSKKKS